MKKLINILQKNKWIILLVLLSLISHWYVFLDFKILNHGDWGFTPASTLRDMLTYSLWNPHSAFGNVMLFGSNMVFFWMAGILNYITPLFDWNIFTRVFFLIPIIFLTPIFTFLFFRRVLKNDFAAFIAAVIFSFNVFFLKLQLDWLTYGSLWWIMPALFLCDSLFEETKKNKYLVYGALLIATGFIIELRITILVMAALALWQIIRIAARGGNVRAKLREAIHCAAMYLMAILSQAFWLVPLKSGLGGDIMSAAASTPFQSFFDLFDALTLHAYSWHGNLVFESFIKQPVEWRLFILPIMAVIGVMVAARYFKSKNERIYVLFFSILLVCGLFLGKQGFDPFGVVYSWAFHNVPIFNLYRESSKFFILIAFSMTFFFAIGLSYLYSRIKIKALGIGLVALVLCVSAFYNLQNFVNQKIGAMTKGVEIKQDYKEIEQMLLGEKDFSRVLWEPARPRFGFFSYLHPFVNMTSMTTSSREITNFELFDKQRPIQDQLVYLLTQNYSQELFRSLAVKYIVLPAPSQREKKDNRSPAYMVDELFENYGPRSSYLSQLNDVTWLKQLPVKSNGTVIYENKNHASYFESVGQLFRINTLANLDRKYGFINSVFKPDKFSFSTTYTNSAATVEVGDVFEKILRENLKDGIIEKTIDGSSGPVDIYGPQSGYVKADKDEIEFRDLPGAGFTKINSSVAPKKFSLTGTSEKTIKYKDSKYAYQNMVINPSLENGLWSPTVGDCNAYDKNPEIGVSLNTESVAEGTKAMRLVAKRHIACTGPAPIKVKPNGKYLFSINYRVTEGREAGYHIAFNNEKRSTTKSRLPVSKEGVWETYTTLVSIPPDANRLNLTLYGFAEEEGLKESMTDYDNLYIAELPDIVGKIFTIRDQSIKTASLPGKISYKHEGPTKKLVQVKKATAPFYLAMSESYHPKWRLELNNPKVQGLASWVPWAKPDAVAASDHFKLNNFLNGWYVDPAKLCKDNAQGCTKNADGSYDIEMVAEFTPQRWFYVGGIISATTLLACITYLIWTWRRRKTS